MTTGLSALLDRLRSTLWFIPTIMTTAAAALAIMTVQLERRYQSPLHEILSFIYSGGPDGAREILSTIAGSMITIAGVSFSIVIVALSLASNQFGHRLLRNFMRDRTNQIVLGTFISTFVYCLLALRSIRSIDENEFVPQFAVTVGIGFALLSLGVLIYFIHHVSLSIQADHVVKVVAEELDECIDRLFPERLGAGSETRDSTVAENWTGWELRPRKDGYLQAIEQHELMAITEEHDLKIELLVRPGSFMTRRIRLAQISPERSWTEDLEDSLLDCFTIGASRTTHQDVEFAIEQLVEIAVRALSPGINAPFTASTCLDRLLQAFARLSDREFPSPNRLSDDGMIRIVGPTTDFRSLCDRAFDPIRHYGSSSPIVLLKMMDILALLIKQCPRADRRAVLIDHATETRRAGEKHLDSENVLRVLTEKYRGVIDDDCQPDTRAG